MSATAPVTVRQDDPRAQAAPTQTLGMRLSPLQRRPSKWSSLKRLVRLA
jgi:hypothetical protein